MEKKTAIRKIKKGGFFTLSDNENAPLWVRGEYVGAGKYSCYKYYDVNHESLMSGDRKVFFRG